MTLVLTKKQNYRLWQSGAFGNKLRSWRTVDEWSQDAFFGLVALRTLLPQGGGPCQYNVQPWDVEEVVSLWTEAGIPRESIMVNEMGPDKSIVLQGEYFNGACVHVGHLLYSRVVKPMRTALAEHSERAYGLQASMILQEAMTPSSFSDWQVLLDRYPDHVLEVSIYGRCLGDIPGRNALVWEVRRY